MTEMEPDRKTAERAIREAYESNPGGWAEHSRYVAEACKNIASRCKGLSGEKAYVLGLLHDIGRYAGVSSEKHLIDGYRYCAARGWKKAAQICISHAFMIGHADRFLPFGKTVCRCDNPVWSASVYGGPVEKNSAAQGVL